MSSPLSLRVSTGVVVMLTISTLRADVTGSILGVVTDPTSAVVRSVRVTGLNTDTNFVHETTSDANGQYRLLALPVGRYEIKAEADGFRTFVAKGIVVAVNEQRRVDVTLQVGATQQQVTVT